MEFMRELWQHKKEPQGRINITIFFVNIFLLLCHIFLMVIYFILNHKFMINYSLWSSLVYILYIPFCYRNIDRYMGIAFLEIWIHLICGILSFGWTPCYQNWCFGMIVAYFLPAFSKEDNNRRPFYYAFLIIFSYFFLATYFPIINLDITVELDIYMNSILFIANNLFVFFAITMFALFYTSRNTRKVNELTRKADYDELTNLYNRHALNEICNNIISDSRMCKKPYSIAMLDIDFFKRVNDTYGHLSGDLVLIELANLLKTSFGSDIVIGRWGGEEFLVVGPHNIKYSDFVSMLKKFRTRVGRHKFLIEGNRRINLTISIGAASIYEVKLLEDAINIADNNLYKAKDTGRNKIIS